MPTTGSSSDPPPLPSHDEVSNAIPNNNSTGQPDDVETEQQRKRAYLSLLPPDQIIELCLSFEQHVPLPIRTGLWPLDIEAEIIKLQYNANKGSEPSDPPQSDPSQDSIGQPTPLALPATPSQQVHPPGPPSLELPIQPLDASFPASSHDKFDDSSHIDFQNLPLEASQKPIDEQLDEPSQAVTQEANSAVEQSVLATSDSQGPSAAPVAPTNEKDEVGPSSPKPVLAAFAAVSASSTPQPAAVPPATYPYAPYGYPLPPGYPPPGTAQAAYPHTPYYPPPGHIPGYPGHYPGYPPYPPPPGYSTQQPPPPPPPPPVSGEDLPSYEDMIVEALADIGEPDGAAPKDLFLWMGARWPLQTNFRPSASQALQKAYRRGRLEKRSGGRYRLNPNWEGGATSKRTTRRPQTLAQTTYAMHQSTSSQTPPSSSPFTTAPLPQRTHISPPPHHTAQQQPYGAYAYPYGAYPGYPGYTTFSARPPTKPTVSPSTSSAAAKTSPPTATTATKTTLSAVSNRDKENAGTEEGSDAWVAAQHILKAINFGSLQDSSTNKPENVATSSIDEAATASEPAVPPPVMASAGIDIHTSTEDDGLGRATLTDDERASLQAQLALLAAQLGEIAAEEDAGDDGAIGEVHEEVAGASSSQSQTVDVLAPVALPASSSSQGPRESVVLDVNQFPDSTEPSVLVTEAPTGSASPQLGYPTTAPPMGSLVPPDGPEKPATPPPAVPPTTSTTVVESEDESDDEDMEMVDVDSYMRSEGIRT